MTASSGNTRRLVLTRSAAGHRRGVHRAAVATDRPRPRGEGARGPDAALHRYVRPAGRGHRERRAHGHRGTRWQARRPRDRVVQGGRRVRPPKASRTPTSSCSVTRWTCSSAPFTPACRWAFTKSRATPACSTSFPTPACTQPHARCARPTCSAPASATTSPHSPWASQWWTRPQEGGVDHLEIRRGR